MEVGGQLCARARFWASLRIDGELSQLEHALLDAHLERCTECRAVVADFTETTGALRATPHVEAPNVSVHVRSARRWLIIAGVAAIVGAGVIGGGAVLGNVTTSTPPAPRPVAMIGTFDTQDQLRELRLTALLAGRFLPRDIMAEPT